MSTALRFAGVVCVLLSTCHGIYIKPGDKHEGIHNHNDPDKPKPMGLDSKWLRGGPMMKDDPDDHAHAEHDHSDHEPPKPINFTQASGDGISPPINFTRAENHECSYTFNVPKAPEHQCGDANKIHNLESKMAEMKTCIDQLKFKSNVMFVTSMMKAMSGQSSGGDSQTNMMDLMMKMLDDSWEGKQKSQEEVKMEKMMKMLKTWMDDDGKKGDSTNAGSERGSTTTEVPTDGSMLTTIERLEAEIFALKAAMQESQLNFQSFADQMEDRLAERHTPSGHSEATGDVGEPDINSPSSDGLRIMDPDREYKEEEEHHNHDRMSD